MTPLLSFCIAFSFLLIGAQAPSPPPTALEGIWREPLLPGEKAADKLVVTIRGEEVTVMWYEGTFRGTLRTDSLNERVVIFGDITLINEKGEHLRRTHTCRWLLYDNQLFLEVSPVRGLNPSKHQLELAPVTFHLEKVQK
jgi:hypothetical protein